jgi:hypothetical protein
MNILLVLVSDLQDFGLPNVMYISFKYHVSVRACDVLQIMFNV